MAFVLVLASIVLATGFESKVDTAFTFIRNNDWVNAASALDEARNEDAGLFAANNFHYLRGRLAENQRDWGRALDEFRQIGSENPLHTLAAWRAARASAQLGNDGEAEALLSVLPRDFPADLKMQIARAGSEALALKIYRDLPIREARFERAKLTKDENLLWLLLRDVKTDDVALNAARLIGGQATNPREQMNVADVYRAHRQFDDALAMYYNAAADPSYAAEARYQIARIHFLREDYQRAVDDYEAIARDFKGTDWEKDSEYQIASCYWRMGDLRGSERAYLAYINKYRARADEGAARNLIDVYRAMGEHQKAVTWLDRTLSMRRSATARQVLLFTKAKVLYTQERYTQALRIFQQLGRARIRTAAGGTTADEVRYFEALCLSKTGKQTAANAIWRRLVRDRFSYYGQRAAAQLGETTAKEEPKICSPPTDTALTAIETDLESLRHPIRMEIDSSASPVSELVFLRLWDEALFWMEQAGTRPDPRTRAKVAYMAGQYHRAVTYADRLPRNETNTMALRYPAGYRPIICDAASTYKVDPLWLHAIIWQESKYNPNARSGAAARGLMQFIPETAEAVGSAIGFSELTLEQLYDPEINIRMGAHLWSSLLEKLKYPEMALAAYNGGPTNVERWKIKGMTSPDDLDMFVADIGFVETKRYVMSVFGAYAAYANHK